MHTIITRIKKLDIIIFLAITACFFYFALIKHFKLLTQITGRVNVSIPVVSVGNFADSPLTGTVMAELQTLCKNSRPGSIGLSWEDFSRIIPMAMEEYYNSFMMFEKLYSVHHNPVRLSSPKMAAMDSYILIRSSQTAYDTALLIAETEHFALLKGK